MSDPSTADDTRRAHEAKATFLRKMAHEIRTPLGSMLMLAELLADNAGGRLNEREIGYAHKIQRAGAEIRGLIEEVLDLSRIETGAVEVEAGEVAITDLIAGAAEDFEELAGDRPVELASAVDSEAPAAVHTDRRQLARLLRLLLARAARVTAEGTVTLRVAAADPMIEIAVTEGGGPISEDQRATAFEPFQPGRRGLELAIARALAELLGGRLTVRPGEGSGNTWSLHLPIS